MTYFGFLFRFLLIPIIILLAVTIWENRKNKPTPGFRGGGAVWAAIGIHILLAVVYTTPWDNYLVATGVWHYNPTLVTGILFGYVPIEEYTFFVLETMLAGLWWWFLARHTSLTGRRRSVPNKPLVFLSTGLLVLPWLVSTYVFFFGDITWTYLSITLFWALPAIVVQLLFGADILWHYRKLVFWAILLPGTYLSLMDILALKSTIWSIAPAQTTGVLFFGILPLEEVVFFLLTNVMITFGMTLLLANGSQERLAEIREQAQAWKERAAFRPGSR